MECSKADCWHEGFHLPGFVSKHVDAQNKVVFLLFYVELPSNQGKRLTSQMQTRMHPHMEINVHQTFLRVSSKKVPLHTGMLGLPTGLSMRNVCVDPVDGPTGALKHQQPCCVVALFLGLLWKKQAAI